MSHRLNLNGAATAADPAASFASLVVKHDQQHEALERLKFLLNHGVGYECWRRLKFDPPVRALPIQI